MTTAHEPRHDLAAVGSVAFAGLTYALFLAVLIYFLGFLGDVGVPRSVDAGGPRAPAWAAVTCDVALFLAFAVPHSVMARPRVKARLGRVTPPHLGRSVYVLIATGSLALLFWQWRPVPGELWRTDGAAAVGLWSTYALGWLIVVLSTFLINHFDLFGLRQVYSFARREEERPVGFRTPSLYRFVRHPMMLGFLLVLWSAPTMTIGHLLFAALFSGYILVAVQYEERDLRSTLPEYDDYARAVPQLVPGVRARRPAARTTS